MESKIVNIFIVLTLVIFTSCTERYDFKTSGGDPKLVVTGYVCTEPGQYAINLSKTGGYFDTNNLKAIPSAEVYINGEKLTPNDSIPSQYLTRDDFCAKSGEKYFLEVRIDFNGDGTKELYTAQVIAPTIVPMLAFRLDRLSNSSDGSLFPLSTMIYFHDPGDVPYYYGAHLNIITARDSADTYKNYRISNTALKYTTNMFDPEVIKGKDVFYPAYSIGKRLLYEPLDTITVYPFDTIVVELNCHSYDYYQFIRNCQDASGSNNPFFMTPAGAISGNISGGAVGAFGVYTVSRMRAIIPYMGNTWTEEEMVKRFGKKWREEFSK